MISESVLSIELITKSRRITFEAGSRKNIFEIMQAWLRHDWDIPWKHTIPPRVQKTYYFTFSLLKGIHVKNGIFISSSQSTMKFSVVLNLTLMFDRNKTMQSFSFFRDVWTENFRTFTGKFLQSWKKIKFFLKKKP